MFKEMIQYIPCTSGGDGTSLQGTLVASYDNLVEMFGEPTYTENDFGDGKVTCQWVVDYQINTEDGDSDYGTFTLYDWKGNRPYLDDQEFTVHIGGKGWNDKYAALAAKEIFDNTDTRYAFDKACMAQAQWFEYN